MLFRNTMRNILVVLFTQFCFICLVNLPHLLAENAIFYEIWNGLVTNKHPLGSFSENVFDYTAGRPQFIPLWSMQKRQFKQCFYEGFPSVFDLSQIFPTGTKITTYNRDLKTTMPVSNIGLIEYTISDTGWAGRETEMPLYYFSRVINLYRYLSALRRDGYKMPFLVDYEETVFLYIYAVCKRIGAGINDRDGMCPNICENPVDVCAKTTNAVAKTCSLVDKGVYENQYQCNCWFGYQWDITQKACKRKMIFPCDLIKMSKFCIAEGTIKCEEDRNSIYPICTCKDGFFGDDCSKVNSMCVLSSHNGTWPPGYENCKVLQGGQCHNITRSEYSCTCPSEYSHDTNFPYPNCLKKRIENLCLRMECLNGGSCVQKSDTATICTCADGFTGFNCQFPLGTWTMWTLWSRCYPKCGPLRYKYKFRDCLGDTTCTGPMLTKMVCENQPCLNIKWRKPLNLNKVLHSIFTVDTEYNPVVWMLKYWGAALSMEIVTILIIGGAFVALTWLMFFFEQAFRRFRVYFEELRNRFFRKQESAD